MLRFERSASAPRKRRRDRTGDRRIVSSRVVDSSPEPSWLGRFFGPRTTAALGYHRVRHQVTRWVLRTARLRAPAHAAHERGISGRAWNRGAGSLRRPVQPPIPHNGARRPVRGSDRPTGGRFPKAPPHRPAPHRRPIPQTFTAAGSHVGDLTGPQPPDPPNLHPRRPTPGIRPAHRRPIPQSSTPAAHVGDPTVPGPANSPDQRHP
jgi:hypothetical protein